MIETHCEKGTALLEFDRAQITYSEGREVNVINNPHDTLDENAYQDFFKQSSRQVAMKTLADWGVFGGDAPVPTTWKTPRAYWGVTHIKQIKNYYQSLAAGVQPDITAAEAFKTHEMIMAINESGRT
ncbi:MAG TPA: hypothetical protein DEH25_12045, partial [Chloroflexi bacterium]|nr:hypothetical protein [Chloroflexota bacterium]